MAKVIVKSEVTAEIASDNKVIAARISDITDVMNTVNSYINDTGLKGKAYTSSKNYMKTYYIPYYKGLIAANEEKKAANQKLQNNLGILIGDMINVESMQDHLQQRRADATNLQYELNRTYSRPPDPISDPTGAIRAGQIRRLQSQLDAANTDVKQFTEVLDSVAAFETASAHVYDLAKDMFAQCAKAAAQLNTAPFTVDIGYTIPATLPAWIAELDKLEQQSAETMSGANNTGDNTSQSAVVEVSKDVLIAAGFHNVTDAMVADLNRALVKYGITSPEDIRQFLSQCLIESDYGNATLEYASGSAYEGRMDLGNTQKGDGVKFKGAGYIQLTGRYNYQQFANSMGDQNIVNVGAVYVSEKYPWEAAGFFWDMKGLTQKINDGAITSVKEVTKVVNGGNRMLTEREEAYQELGKYYK